MDFLLVIIEPFSLRVMVAEALRTKMMRKSLKFGILKGAGSVSAEISGRR